MSCTGPGPSEVFDYRCALVRPVDGDSLIVLADLGFHARQELEVRLLDVHAPELSQPGGRETADFANGWLASVAAGRPNRRWPFAISTVQTTVYEPETRMTFVRYLATVYPFERRESEASLNCAVTTFLSGHPEWPPGR
jgi:endonuclease YncB( thermonuclease family)